MSRLKDTACVSFWTLQFRLLRRVGLRTQAADEGDPDEAQEGEDLFHGLLVLRQHPRKGRPQRALRFGHEVGEPEL